MNKLKQIQHSEWVDAMFPKKEVPPPGAYTVRQVQLKSGLSYSTVFNVLKKKELSGELHSKVFLVNGKHTTYYWPRQLKEQKA